MTTPPEQARRIIFPNPGEVTLEGYELEAPAPDDLLIRTLYSLMSIGTETTILHRRYAPDSHFARMFSFPQLQTGVQAVGVVEQAGAEQSDFNAGDLVYMRMAHGSHQVQAASQCSPIPTGIDLKLACWAGLAKTAYRAAWAGEFGSDQDVLIIGAGPVGQMLTRWASVMQCPQITVVDISPYRLAHATAGGATKVLQGDISNHLQEIQTLNNGNGPSLVIDITGSAKVFQSALAAAGKFAKVIVLGDTGHPQQQCLSSDVMTKGLTIQATHDSHDLDGWTERRVDELFFSLVASGRFELQNLISHTFLPQSCAQAYQLADTERETTMGILFDWTDNKEDAYVPDTGR